jgi:putative DNA primase/helicase
VWQWQSPGGGIVRELSKAVARAYPSEDGWGAHKKKCLSNGGITACLALTETDHRVAVSIHDLDARPWEMNTPGGILDLHTGRLRESDPRSLHTKSTSATPDQGANQSEWMRFLSDTFGGDIEMTSWLQRLFGYTCIGEVREAILPLFFGLGANGKTTILEAIAGLLGDYATEAPQGFLVQGPPQHPAEIAELAGARFVIASETNEDQKFDEAKVKQLTGGDKLRGRFMRQDWFGFAPSHTLFLMTNHRPEVRSGGHGFWRRVREVPFNHEVPLDKKIEKYHDVLITAHGPAIMAWLARGAAEYAKHGLKDPEGVRVATSEYQASTDTITRFIDDMCIVGGGEHVKCNSSKVRSAYELWCEQEGEKPVSAKAMTQQMAAKFSIGRARDMRQRFLTNVSLVGGDDE